MVHALCVCVCICEHGCVFECVQRVRLIEAVRVKMIPSGRRSRWRQCVWVQQWVTETDQDRTLRVKHTGKGGEGAEGLRNCFCPPALQGSDTQGA